MDMLHATIHQKDMVKVLNDRSTLSYMQANVDHNDHKHTGQVPCEKLYQA